MLALKFAYACERIQAFPCICAISMLGPDQGKVLRLIYWVNLWVYSWRIGGSLRNNIPRFQHTCWNRKKLHSVSCFCLHIVPKVSRKLCVRKRISFALHCLAMCLSMSYRYWNYLHPKGLGSKDDGMRFSL